MPVAVYVRVSTEEQRERQSILTQREFADRYCVLHKLSVHLVYADDGVSGTVPLDRRAEGGRILRDAKLGKFDQLLVYKLDRLGRDTRLILNAVDELERVGVRIRSMTEEFDTGTATGRLMLTMLSGFASHEREVIRERSVAGALRVAEGGAWMGGIVPFGYRKVGEKRDARLVVSEEQIPGAAMSEADVIREVFRMAATERKSCREIAGRLNELSIPCSYVRDDRLLLRGKRKQKTSGLWSPGRVRGFIISKTYKGVHEFGKRTSSERPVVVRSVPAIITDSIWQKAQTNLKSHLLFSKRNAQNQYLLRGLIKCELCNRTFVGGANTRPNGRREFYYRCNGAHSPSVYRPTGKCPAKAVRGDDLELQVWSDVEAFLRDPAPVLEQLHAKLESEAKGSGETAKQISRLETLLSQKATERSRILGLFRRGRLNDSELDAQMDEIAKEEASAATQLETLRGQIADVKSVASTLSSAEALLRKLRTRLDEPVSWELKRHLIEVLLSSVSVETFERDGVKQTNTTVTYRFSEPDRPLTLILPQSYNSGGVVRISTDPKTVGDHLRKTRLRLKLMQREVAAQLDVDVTSVFNWENNVSNPAIPYMPAIIRFLGYNPLPQATTLAARLIRRRTTLGLSQKESAKSIGVDPCTLARWERGEREPAGKLLNRVKQFLKDDEDESSDLRLVS